MSSIHNNKISVIIPCHNVENYIERCLHSIENQTVGIQNLEVILVDDASSDRTLEHLHAFEQKHTDSVMVVECEENIKAAAARNLGLSYATGDYISFVDADDMIAPDMLLAMSKKMEEHGCDMVECDYLPFSEVEECHESVSKDRYYDLTDDVIRKKYIIECGMKSAVWGRLYSRQFIEAHHLYFLPGTIYEDVYYSGMGMFLYQSVYHLSRTCYYYFQNPSGIISTSSHLTAKDSVSTIQKFLTDLDQRGMLEEIIQKFYAELEYYCAGKGYLDPLQMILRTEYSEKEQDIIFYRDSLLQVFPKVYNNIYMKQLAEQSELGRMAHKLLSV